MKPTHTLLLDDVKLAAAAAEAEARTNGWAVSIAICDAGGHALWLQRMDGAPLMSAVVAPEKARTSVLSGKPSKAFEDMVNNGRFAALAMPVVPLEGGEPIVFGGNVIGVSETEQALRFGQQGEDAPRYDLSSWTWSSLAGVSSWASATSPGATAGCWSAACRAAAPGCGCRSGARSTSRWRR